MPEAHTTWPICKVPGSRRAATISTNFLGAAVTVAARHNDGMASPDIDLIVTRLRHQHGWTIDQIADLCNLTKTDVRIILQNAAARGERPV